MATPYLRLQDVVKSYDGRINAVEDVNIDIERGEFVTFLGPSGSGKTTTLMMVAGFEEPTAGTILLEGKDLTHTQPYNRNIGMVFQNYALFPHMSVARNVGFPLRMRRRPKAEIADRVAKVLELVGLTEFAQRQPRELSGGQQQRVALARGLVFNPDVLLLDEPLGALDKKLREQMQVEIKRIHREVGITMIYVTHDQSEAMTMSDRVAVFSRGRIEQMAPPLDIYEFPCNRFVGEFIGDSNFFSARLVAGQPDRAVIPGIGEIRTGASGRENVAPGGAADILVRPERMQLVEGDAGDLNVIETSIDTIVNYGDSVLVLGDCHGLPLRLRLAGRDVRKLKEGATVRVGWSPADSHIVPASASS